MTSAQATSKMSCAPRHELAPRSGFASSPSHAPRTTRTPRSCPRPRSRRAPAPAKPQIVAARRSTAIACTCGPSIVRSGFVSSSNHARGHASLRSLRGPGAARRAPAPAKPARPRTSQIPLRSSGGPVLSRDWRAATMVLAGAVDLRAATIWGLAGAGALLDLVEIARSGFASSSTAQSGFATTSLNLRTCLPDRFRRWSTSRTHRPREGRAA